MASSRPSLTLQLFPSQNSSRRCHIVSYSYNCPFSLIVRWFGCHALCRHLLMICFTDSIKEKMPDVEAEKLLRIALFSDTLKLSRAENKVSPDDLTPSAITSSSRLVLKRQTLAQSLRENRKKGVVPVFVSLMWFLFSLAISIQASFGDLGSNQTAHDLALGLLLGWLPVCTFPSLFFLFCTDS